MKKLYFTKSERVILLDDSTLGASYRFKVAKLKFKKALGRAASQIVCSWLGHDFPKINRVLHHQERYGEHTCQNCRKRLYFDL